MKNDYTLSICIAGNTAIPCFSAIKSIGYDLKLTYTKGDDGSYHARWEANKDNRRFSATSPEELLGIVYMCELRGDCWQAKKDEHREFDKLLENAPVYFENEQGELRLIEEE